VSKREREKNLYEKEARLKKENEIVIIDGHHSNYYIRKINSKSQGKKGE